MTAPYSSTRFTPEGTETTETSIVRSGGAVDPTGQAQSRKIVTSANAQWLRPFRCEPWAIWNDTVGAPVTVTVYGSYQNTGLPMNDQIWMDIEYLGDASSTLGKITTTTKANILATAVYYEADTALLRSPGWEYPNTSFDGLKTAGVTLSNGNLTVTHNITANNQGAVSSTFLSTGKHYFEIISDTTHIAQCYVGLIHPEMTDFFSPSYIGTPGIVTSPATVSWPVYTNGGVARTFLTGPGVTPDVPGQVICFAADLDARLVWVRVGATNWNNDPTANPTTGVGGHPMGAGPLAPAVRFHSNTSSGSAYTGNFVGPFAITPPLGYTTWAFKDAFTHFKLSATLNGVGVTWPPLDTSFDPTSVDPDTLVNKEMGFTNNNLTVTRLNSLIEIYNGARSTLQKTTGKFYFEITVGSMSAGVSIGIAGPAVTYGNIVQGLTLVWIVNYSTGRIWNGADTAKMLGGNLLPGDVIQFAFDLDARLGWARQNTGLWNGTAGADPTTGVGGIVVPAGYMTVAAGFGAATNTRNVTANFGATPFVYTPPVSFTYWIGDPVPVSNIQPGQPGLIHVRVKVGRPTSTFYLDPKIELTPASIALPGSHTSSRYSYEGLEFTETNVAHADGAAYSRVVTNALNSQWLRPYRAEPLAVWNSTVNATVTVTVRGIVNSSVMPLNDEIWMDVEYLKADGLGNIATTTKANILAAGVPLTADGAPFIESNTVVKFDGVISGGCSVSADGLTVTHNSGNSQGASSASFFSTGKRYFEIKVDGLINIYESIGIFLTPASDFSTLLPSWSGCSVTPGATVYANGVTGPSLGAPSLGDIYRFAIDFDAKLIWVRHNFGAWNGNALANPATGVGGMTIANGPHAPFVRFSGSGGNIHTGNFGPQGYAAQPPVGFIPFASTWTPFKLATTLNGVPGSSTPISLPTTLNPSSITNVALSNGNLTATNTATTTQDQGAKGFLEHAFNSGKYYYEVTIVAVTGGSGFSFGIGPYTNSYTNMNATATDGLIYRRLDGATISNGSSAGVAAVGIAVVGETIGIAYDMDNRRVWLRRISGGAPGSWNNNVANDPATNVGGITLTGTGPVVPFTVFGFTGGLPGNSTTHNFGATAFLATPPAGFSNIPPLSYTPPVPNVQPGLPGLINVRVKAGKPGGTFYIDPVPILDPPTLFGGGGGGGYPDAVIFAGAQMAWDLKAGGTGHTGTLPLLTSENVPDGWTLTSTAVTTNRDVPAVLGGFDTDGRQVVIKHSYARVRNCLITVKADGTDRDGVVISTGENNIVETAIEFCTIDGKTLPTAASPHKNMQCGIREYDLATGIHGTNITRCRIMNTKDDSIKLRSAYARVAENYITIGGMGDASAVYDAIDISNGGLGIVIADNFFSAEPNPNSYGRHASATLNNVKDLVFRRNIIGYHNDLPDNAGAKGAYAVYSGHGSNSNIEFSNNVFEYNVLSLYDFGSNPYGIKQFKQNYRLRDAALIPKPL